MKQPSMFKGPPALSFSDEQLLDGAADEHALQALPFVVRFIASRWRPGRPMIAVESAKMRQAWANWISLNGSPSIACRVAVGMQLDDWAERGSHPPTLAMIMRQDSDRLNRFLDLYERVKAGEPVRWPAREGPRRPQTLHELREYMRTPQARKELGWRFDWVLADVAAALDDADAREILRAISEAKNFL